MDERIMIDAGDMRAKGAEKEHLAGLHLAFKIQVSSYEFQVISYKIRVTSYTVVSSISSSTPITISAS
jgi:hypothetical protein